MKKQSKIVVISTTGDVHIPLVQKHLQDSMILIDPLRLQAGTPITFTVEDKKTIVTYDNQRLDCVRSVWLRKPRSVDKDTLPIKEPYKEYSYKSLEILHHQLYSAFSDALWLSDYYAEQRASNKTLQLQIASQIGFNVPDTVITSDKHVAENFIAKHGTVIMKTLTHFNVEIEGVRKVLYATRVSADKMPVLSNLYVSPAIFQAVIKPQYDVRVNVVGDTVFAAKIINKGLKEESNARDWRRGHFEGEIIITTDEAFPAELAELCRQHVQRLGLCFGALDFVVDEHGVYWFLENNPNGQWGFIERTTGQPIGKAIAALLERTNLTS